MDEPGEWAEPWPYWKFGLKQNDLHDSLHLRYNTIPSAIQDPEAFHHDVYELSTRASDLSEFERLMEERKTLRLKELDTMLEDASLQIIGCPKLIGTDQWSLAVQLFRTKSLDSLVRYFASYLPDQHPWHVDFDSVNSGSSEAVSPVSSNDYADYDGPILFHDPEEDEAFFTHEPSEAFSTCGTAVDLADQPERSNTMHSVDSGVSVTDRKQRRKFDHNSCPPSRNMSVSESEPEHMLNALGDSVPTLHDDEGASPSDDPETPDTCNSEFGDATGTQGKDALATTIVDGEDVDGFFSISHAHLDSTEPMDSDAPTPKAAATFSPATPATPLFETKLSPLRTHNSSTSRTHPHHAHHNHLNNQQQHRNLTNSRQLRRRDGSLEPQRPKRVQGGKTGRGRGWEVSPDGVRSRARARRRRADV